MQMLAEADCGAAVAEVPPRMRKCRVSDKRAAALALAPAKVPGGPRRRGWGFFLVFLHAVYRYG
jgi:hypothetical protein